MSNETILKTRFINKHDTEVNWKKATNFIPKQGELIVYDIDENYSYERFKIGDGVRSADALPFATVDAKEKFSFGPFTNAGWYRIAETEAGLGNFTALFQLDAIRLPIKEEEVASTSIITISGTYTEDPKITFLTSAQTWWGFPIDSLRVVYPKTDGFHDNMKAYLEVHVTATVKPGKEGIITISSLLKGSWNFYSDAIISEDSINDLETDGTFTWSKVEKKCSQDLANTTTPMEIKENYMSNQYGWKRIAKTTDVKPCLNMFDITCQNETGAWGRLLFVASSVYPTADNYAAPELTVLHFNNRTPLNDLSNISIPKIRIVYDAPTTTTLTNVAYLEVYNTQYIRSLIKYGVDGWQILDEPEDGNIPEGYLSTEIDLTEYKNINNAITDLYSKHKEFEYKDLTQVGWYRIAETETNIFNYSNLIQIQSNMKGYSNISLVSTSGTFTTTPDIIPIVSSSYGGRPITDVRIVYPKDYTGEKAYFEIYVAKPYSDDYTTVIDVKIKSILNSGWNFYTYAQEISTYDDTFYNIETKSLDTDLDALVDSNANKLDKFNNNVSDSFLDVAYIAKRSGGQGVKAISEDPNPGTFSIRSNSGELRGQTYDNSQDNVLTNLYYIKNNTTPGKTKKLTIPDVSTGVWSRVATLGANSFGIFNITLNGQQSGSGYFSSIAGIVSNMYPSGTLTSPKITILHHDYRLKAAIDKVRIVYNSGESYLEIKTAAIANSNKPSLRIDIFGAKNITLPDNYIEGSVPANYKTEEYDVLDDVNNLYEKVKTLSLDISTNYETKVDSDSKLEEAKAYADAVTQALKDTLLNGAGEAYDTLLELANLIDENVDAIQALEEVATNKADREHNHDELYYTKSQIDEALNQKTQIQLITWEDDD